MKILWAGPYFSEYAFTVKRAPNIASTKWSHGFVRGLRANGVDVRILTLCPEQAWPRGRVFWQNADARLFDHDCPVTAVSYLNVSIAREIWQNAVYAYKTRQMLSAGGFDAFACYNVCHPYHVAAMRVAKKMGVKVVPIVLDGGTDPVADNFAQMSHDARYADGITFLSKWGAMNFPAKGRKIFQMEGGVDEWRGVEPVPHSATESLVVTYAGAFADHRGQALVEMVKSCRRQNVRFVFCGKWDRKHVGSLFGEDPRVEIRGMVSNDELSRVYAQTDVFVNSRDASWGHNLVNFPSKISAYLGYGRPIVSNWIVSLPDDYRNLLAVSEDDSGQAMAKKLEEVLDWSLERRIQCYHMLHDAYVNSKSWNKQAQGFLNFVHTLDGR